MAMPCGLPQRPCCPMFSCVRRAVATKRLPKDRYEERLVESSAPCCGPPLELAHFFPLMTKRWSWRAACRHRRSYWGHRCWCHDWSGRFWYQWPIRSETPRKSAPWDKPPWLRHSLDGSSRPNTNGESSTAYSMDPLSRMYWCSLHCGWQNIAKPASKITSTGTRVLQARSATAGADHLRADVFWLMRGGEQVPWRKRWKPALSSSRWSLGYQGLPLNRCRYWFSLILCCFQLWSEDVYMSWKWEILTILVDISWFLDNHRKSRLDAMAAPSSWMLAALETEVEATNRFSGEVFRM